MADKTAIDEDKLLDIRSTRLSAGQQRELLAIARAAIEAFLENKKISEPRPADALLRKHAGAFVTLWQRDEAEPGGGAGVASNLKGCIGHVEADRPLDQVVAQMGASALGVVAIFVISDGGQGIMNGALRGAADVWVSMLLMMSGFWAVSLPLAWWLAFHADFGVNGLIWGLNWGAAVAMVLMMLRFRVITQRRLRAAQP